MRIAYNSALHQHLQTIPRTHPWTTSAIHDDARYYDLRAHPELIRGVLEDFQQLEGSAAGENFYALIEWLNGPESPFETNDCLLRAADLIAGGAGGHEYRGHITMFFRALELNGLPEPMSWLCDRIETSIAEQDQDLESAALDFALWPTLFLEGSVNGSALHLRFSARHESDSMTRDALSKVFLNLRAALQKTAQAIPADGWLSTLSFYGSTR